MAIGRVLLTSHKGNLPGKTTSGFSHSEDSDNQSENRCVNLMLSWRFSKASHTNSELCKPYMFSNRGLHLIAWPRYLLIHLDLDDRRV